ncbi:DUF3857 domain-containing protein [Mucilaginibacter sp. Bleaf8]|uniref:DUF3857 domain-containing protein n=1 Tax=Mucilaginibacter sp. Bleaf8 TaxID=2834430 RepID=UPI001BD023A4|nr:DUF3857 domain-containing protein [Mucilaginibacter sp. Bleaf8]MBS7565862.1 DUF3857 domain-containing protein [Mucilaginibacter sp. Bleaf8]
MTKISTVLIALCTACSAAFAQTPAAPGTQSYGKIDKADLELKECAFEKDANAMVLFHKGDVYFDNDFNVVLEAHKRIKIFKEAGKKEADIRLEFYGGNHFEYLTGLQAEVFNLNDGKVEITKLDKKQVFTEIIDKSRTALVFSFPNVKPGSVIEFSYKKTTNAYYRIPDWYFQGRIPVRYSEFTTTIPEYFYFRTQTHIYEPLVKSITTSESRSLGGGQSATAFTEERRVMAMANVHSLQEEPYMRSLTDNLQGLHLQLTTVKPTFGFTRVYSDTWAKAGGNLAEDEDFGVQLKRKLANEETIVTKAKALKTDDEKIAYIFNEVKNAMKWNGSDIWYTDEGTVKAWEKKTGNSTEINLIMHHLLKQSGVKSYPMVVSTRSNGQVNPAFSFLNQFNRAVVYIPVDSTKRYILDASSKYNSYLETPDNILNSYGLWIDKENKQYDLMFIDRKQPVRKVVFVNAEIKPEGKMSGTAEINCFSYNRISDIEHYKTDGEKKYIDFLREKNNALTINSLKFNNMEVDSLPLAQNLNFDMELTGSDKDYIYFSPNLFTSLRVNPFLNENRTSDVDFGHLDNLNISGIYKIPSGYKPEALPQSISIVMPDKSIVFRRIVAEQEGTIVVRYFIDHKKTVYFKEDYGDLHAFYKKMHELLNEQVVLKKS